MSKESNEKAEEWEKFQKEIKEIDKRPNRTGVNIITKMIDIKKEKEKIKYE